MEKRCLNCNGIIKVKPSQYDRKKYCSRSCKTQYQKTNPPEFWTNLSQKKEVNCSFCNQKLLRKRCLIKNQQHHFCNKECRKKFLQANKQIINQHLLDRVNVTCQYCNKTFEVIKSRANSAKYCSRSCLGKANGIRGKLQYRNRITVECSNCKAKFEKKPSVVYTHNFCSINCMSEYYTNTKMFAGENSGTWQGGDIDYYGQNWRNQRRKARKRDNFTCQDCGKTENEYGHELSVHHIVPFREFQGDWKAANKLSNLVSLCEYPCHRKRHSTSQIG